MAAMMPLVIQAAEPWQGAYAEILREKLQDPGKDPRGGARDWQFFLLDIDLSGTPELIVLDTFDSFVYTFRDGVAVLLEFVKNMSFYKQ